MVSFCFKYRRRLRSSDVKVSHIIRDSLIILLWYSVLKFLYFLSIHRTHFPLPTIRLLKKYIFCGLKYISTNTQINIFISTLLVASIKCRSLILYIGATKSALLCDFRPIIPYRDKYFFCHRTSICFLDIIVMGGFYGKFD